MSFVVKKINIKPLAFAVIASAGIALSGTVATVGAVASQTQVQATVNGAQPPEDIAELNIVGVDQIAVANGDGTYRITLHVKNVDVVALKDSNGNTLQSKPVTNDGTEQTVTFDVIVAPGASTYRIVATSNNPVVTIEKTVVISYDPSAGGGATGPNVPSVPNTGFVSIAGVNVHVGVIIAFVALMTAIAVIIGQRLRRTRIARN